MSFRSRTINTLVKGFRANSRITASRFASSYSRYAYAPSSNVVTRLFATATETPEKKEGLSPEEAKKMAAEMLFNRSFEPFYPYRLINKIMCTLQSANGLSE